jgi:murein DD-endopeptidase MepM/ murein hydrolase activator NlpD
MDPVSAKMALQLGASLARSRTLRNVVVAVVVVQAVVLGLVTFVPLYLAASVGPSSAQRVWSAANAGPAGCDPAALDLSGQPVPKVSDLAPTQVRVSQALYLTALAVGGQLGWPADKSERAALVAISAAKQESQLGLAAGIDRPNGDGDAGILQQRTLPGWYGTVAQVNDPAYAGRVFLTGKKIGPQDVAAARAAGNAPAGAVGYTIPGLQQVAGWERMPVTQAAQKVQRSAFPDAYAQHEPIARGLVQVFKQKLDPASTAAVVTAAASLCGPVDALGCPPTGSPAEQGVQPDSLRVIRCVKQQFPAITVFYGLGQRETANSDHPSGRGVDVMIPDYASPAGRALGQQIADWLKVNAARLGVKYEIWNGHIWSVQRDAEGWRLCGSAAAGCYNGADDTAAHRDHVHVSTFGDSAGTAIGGDVSPVTSAIVKPVTGYRLTASFGQCSPGVWARCHTGQDFAVGEGTPIRAVMGGTVVSTGSCGCAYGNLTKIANGDLTFYYAHQKQVSVTEGQVVQAGQVIGQVGWTGNVRPRGPSGSHLHLEVRIKGRPVDPLAWLTAKGVL